MRRRAPLTVLVLASLPVLALIGLRYTSAVIGSGLFLAAYTVAAWRTPRCLVAAVGWVTVLLATLAVARPSALPPGELLTNAGLFVGAFGLGRSTRVRHANTALLRERAELAERGPQRSRSSGGQRGAAADRPGAARRHRPLPRRHRPASPGRSARHRRRPGGGQGGPGRGLRHESHRADRDPPDPGGDARRRSRSRKLPPGARPELGRRPRRRAHRRRAPGRDPNRRGSRTVSPPLWT